MPLLKQWTEEDAVFAVWKVSETADELSGMLTADLPYGEEIALLKAESRKLEYLAVRVLLRTLCGEEKHILHYPSGKPFLKDASFRISISHTKGYVAIGLHPFKELGIDIECVSGRVCKVASRFMHPDELKVSDNLMYLLVCWSGKETMYKLLGEEGVDFSCHLRISPFELQQNGVCDAYEYRTSRKQCFSLHYMLHSDFVCTWCVAL